MKLALKGRGVNAVLWLHFFDSFIPPAEFCKLVSEED
jgi:hypothetical protein